VWDPGSLPGSPVSVNPVINTTYSITGTAAGCTGSNTLTVNVNPNPVVSTLAAPVVICVGASSSLSATSSVPGTSFSWLPGSLTGSPVSVNPVISTTYTVTGTASGCTGSSIVMVTVNPNPVISLAATPSVICAGASSTLNASSTVTGATYLWLPGNLNGSTVSVSPAASTIYSVTGTASGCTGSNTVTVNVNPNPVISAIASPSSICASASSSLTASSTVPGTTYSWLPGSLSGSPVTVSPATTTVYTITGIAAGCTGNSTVTLTVNNNLTLTAAASPSSICMGGTSILSCSGADNYLWTPGSLTGNAINVNPNATAIYTINGTSVTGCTGTTTVTITVNPNPVISATAWPTSVCQGQSSVLTGSGALNYIWLPVGLSGSSVTVTPIANSTYTVSGTDVNGCTGSTTVAVNYIGVPQMNIIPSPQAGCSPLSVDFSYATVAPILDSSWQWSFGDIGAPINSSNELSPTHIYNNGGIYIVQLNALTTSGCLVSSVDTVFVSSKPIADFYYTPDFAYTNYPAIYFKDQSAGVAVWNWDFGDPSDPALNISHLINPVHLFSDSGSYQVQLIVENNGCRDTTVKNVHIYLDALIFVPNAFTPNGDGINDIFIPAISGVEENSYSFMIFDRWGKEIFNTIDLSEGWNGRNNEKEVALGVYSYVIEYREILGMTHKIKGKVALIR
jgi:gliding motility-associated-like protein